MDTNTAAISPQSQNASNSLLDSLRAKCSRLIEATQEKTDRFDAASKKFVQRRNHYSKASMIFGLLVVLIIMIAGICFLTLYSGAPGFDVNNVIAPKDPKDNQFNIDFGAINRSPSINISVRLNVTVENKNGFRLYFPEVNVDVFHPKLLNVSLGKTVVTDLELNPHSSVYITVPINLTYFLKTDPQHVVADNLMGACTLPAGKGDADTNIELAMTLTPNLKLFNLFPTKVEKMNKLNSFQCPYKLPRTMSIAGFNVNLDKIDWNAFQKSDLVRAFLPTIAE
jgi:hypothetical protein